MRSKKLNCFKAEDHENKYCNSALPSSVSIKKQRTQFTQASPKTTLLWKPKLCWNTCVPEPRPLWNTEQTHILTNCINNDAATCSCRHETGQSYFTKHWFLLTATQLSDSNINTRWSRACQYILKPLSSPFELTQEWVSCVCGTSTQARVLLYFWGQWWKLLRFRMLTEVVACQEQTSCDWSASNSSYTELELLSSMMMSQDQFLLLPLIHVNASVWHCCKYLYLYPYAWTFMQFCQDTSWRREFLSVNLKRKVFT